MTIIMAPIAAKIATTLHVLNPFLMAVAIGASYLSNPDWPPEQYTSHGARRL